MIEMFADPPLGGLPQPFPQCWIADQAGQHFGKRLRIFRFRQQPVNFVRE